MPKDQSEPSLFDRIVEMTGLSQMIGGGMVRRSLEHVGTDAWHADFGDYERAIPFLQERLVTYLSPADARARCHEIAATLRRMSSALPPEDALADLGPPGDSSGDDSDAALDLDDTASFRIQRSIRLMQDVRRRLNSTIPPARSPSENPDED